LPRYCTQSELEKKFSTVGTVTDCYLVFKNNMPTGYGFVHFSSPEEAENAVRTLNGCELEVPIPSESKKRLKVELYKKKQTGR